MLPWPCAEAAAAVAEQCEETHGAADHSSDGAFASDNDDDADGDNDSDWIEESSGHDDGDDNGDGDVELEHDTDKCKKAESKTAGSGEAAATTGANGAGNLFVLPETATSWCFELFQ